jgi:hypothetical protein
MFYNSSLPLRDLGIFNPNATVLITYNENFSELYMIFCIRKWILLMEYHKGRLTRRKDFILRLPSL